MFRILPEQKMKKAQLNLKNLNKEFFSYTLENALCNKLQAKTMKQAELQHQNSWHFFLIPTPCQIDCNSFRKAVERIKLLGRALPSKCGIKRVSLVRHSKSALKLQTLISFQHEKSLKGTVVISILSQISFSYSRGQQRRRKHLLFSLVDHTSVTAGVTWGPAVLPSCIIAYTLRSICLLSRCSFFFFTEQKTWPFYHQSLYAL